MFRELLECRRGPGLCSYHYGVATYLVRSFAIPTNEVQLTNLANLGNHVPIISAGPLPEIRSIISPSICSSCDQRHSILIYSTFWFGLDLRRLDLNHT